MVTLHATIHDRLIALLSDTFSCNVLVHPIRISPHVRSDLAKLYWATRVVCDDIFEGLVELAIVQEHIWIMEPPVEMSFYTLDALHNALQFFVACEYDEGSVCAWLLLCHFWVEAAVHKNLVMLLVDPPSVI